MYCKKCGAKNKDDARFCAKCGCDMTLKIIAQDHKKQKKVEKKRHTYLGQFLDNGSKESEAIKKSINDLKKEYGDEVFTIEPEMDGITMDVHFKADSVTAKQALNDFMDDAKSIEKQYGESDTLSVMLDNASGGLSEANEILGKYGDLYEQAQEAKLVAEEQTFKADGKDQTALKWLNDYTKAVKNYNDALTEGDSDKITQAAGEFALYCCRLSSQTVSCLKISSSQIQ